MNINSYALITVVSSIIIFLLTKELPDLGSEFIAGIFEDTLKLF